MPKTRFGDVLRNARERQGFSLRQLAERVDIDYSRLAKIEHGTRPAPGLAAVRRLAEALDLDMADLVVSAGTSREVMESLLWAERLHSEGSLSDKDTYTPDWTPLLAKNVYQVRVQSRDGALCKARLGSADLEILSFSREPALAIHIPPETVVIHRSLPDPEVVTAGNVLRMCIKRIRVLGQAVHLVLKGNGFELNTLHARPTIDRLHVRVGEDVFASVQATAISTGMSSKEDG